MGGSIIGHPETANYHEISANPWNGYLVVRIRLFSKFGAPIYYVVAGNLNRPGIAGGVLV